MTKAMEISLRNLLNFQPDQGEIFLKDRRMVISSADALGMLRKDLIAALGKERAKRFLLRYGWNCGVNDARNLKEMFDWDRDLEWLLAGPRMHNISGSVYSEAIKVDVNREAGTFYLEGIWRNSHEGEQHLMHFSYSQEAVCYNLIGYAGGYSSEYFGKKVIYKEVECVGRGDKQCHYIGKTVEEWGDDIAADLADYEEENLADELDCAYRRIEKQKEILKLGTSMNQKLTQIVLQGKGLDSIAKALGESLLCSVVIENQNFETVSNFGEVPSASTKSLLDLLQSDIRQQANREKLLKERRTVCFEVEDNGNVAHKRLITPIVLRNQICGFISLIENQGTLGEPETVQLERAATVCAFQMLNERTAIETEQRMKGELLDELLNPDVDMAAISKRMMYLGYKLEISYYVFVFQIDSLCAEMSQRNEDKLLDIRNQIIDHLSVQLDRSGYRSLISTKLNRVFALIPQDFIQQQRLTLKQYGEYLVGQVVDAEANGKIRITLGISNLHRELASFYKGYQETNKAIEVAHARKKGDQVILSSELGHLRLLLNARDPDELESFAYEKLKELYEYDQKNNSGLLKTLYLYIENEYNLHKTALAMNVSISGMRYRLRRIQELAKVDLTDSSTRFENQLALEIFLVMGKLTFE